MKNILQDLKPYSMVVGSAAFGPQYRDLDIVYDRDQQETVLDICKKYGGGPNRLALPKWVIKQERYPNLDISAYINDLLDKSMFTFKEAYENSIIINIFDIELKACNTYPNFKQEHIINNRAQYLKHLKYIMPPYDISNI